MEAVLLGSIGPNMRLVALRLDLDEIERRLDVGELMEAIAADLAVTDRTIRNHLHAAGRPLATQRRRQQQTQRLHDPDWLRDQYLVRRRAPSAMAKEVGASTAEIHDALESFGIRRPPAHPELDRQALVDAFESGGTVRSIARSAGVERATVRRAMRRHGVVNPRADWGQRPARLDDGEWLRDQYVGHGRSMVSIAAEVGADPATVRAALDRHGIERRSQRVVVRDIDPNWLHEKYVIDRWTLRVIAQERGVSESTVSRAIRRYEIPLRTGPVPGRKNPHPHADLPGGLDPQWLRERYVRQHITIARIAAQAGVSTPTVHRAIHHHGLVRCSVRRGEGALVDVDWLRERCVREGANPADIAAELSVPTKRVRRALATAGIETRSAN